MIGIICAMQEEAKAIITAFGLKKIRNPFFELYGNKKMTLIITKVGKAQAALGATYLLQNFKLKMLINAGVVGRLNPDIAIGEVVLVRSVQQHDVFVPAEIRPAYLYEPITCFLPKSLAPLRRVKLLTGDQFMEDTRKVKLLAQVGDIVDMEGYSIALASQTFKIPCVMIKAVSDGADEEASRMFMQNLDVAMAKTIESLSKLVL